MTRRAVILAGGEGTRLRPLTEEIPKPFIPIAGKPAIEYGIEAAVDAGITEILVTTFYKPQRLIDRLQGGGRFGAKIFYSVEDDALGTAGGVAKARSWFDDTFVVMSGDVLADVNLKELIAFHEKSGAEATMALTEVDDPTQFGVVATDQAGRVQRFQEKPKTKEEAFSNLVNAGIYVLSPSVLNDVPEGKPFDFSKDLFPKLLKENRPLYGHRLDGVWMDVGRPDDLLKAARLMGERHHGGAYRHADAKVETGATLRDSDVYADARVAAGATVENSVLYAGAIVEKGATVRGSLLSAGATIGEGATVEDCVLGPRAEVAKGETRRGEKISASGSS